MKKYFILGAFLLAAGLISAQTTTDQKQQNQKARIKQGVTSGELNRKEAKQLRRQQKNIRKTERRVNADGVVTAKEQAVLDRKQKKASKNIYRKKHN